LPSNSYEELLDRAARLWGIDPDYWDIWGRHHVTSTGTRQAILRAMGVDTADADGIARAIAQREYNEHARLVPPCLVIGENDPCARPK
jgi:4-alpha-glucanotransferase